MHWRRGGGFSLLEVMVALLVLAVGVIAGAGSQMAALRTRQHAALQSDGVQLASSLADRMRAHGAADDALNPYLALRYDAASDGAPAGDGAACHAVACSSADLAARDLFEVKEALHRGYPGGRVLVCRDGAPWQAGALRWECAASAGAPIVIKIGWRERRSAHGDGGSDAAPKVAVVAGGGP